jgi:SCY1-like protein 1
MGQTLGSGAGGGGGGDVPVTLGREIKQSGPQHYSLHDATDHTRQGKAVSVFTVDNSQSDGGLGLGSNFFRRLRALRHPSILTVVHATVIDAKKTMYIVTDHVEPLRQCIAALDAESILLGIHQITRALLFLNKEGNMIHGHVNMDTVYVNAAGDWQLGGFEFCAPAAESTSPTSLLHHALTSSTRLSHNLQWPPESPSVSPALDAWLLGVFVWSCYNAEVSISSFDKAMLKDTSRLPASLKEHYIRLLSANPSTRLSLDYFLNAPVFGSSLWIQTVAFLETLSIKDSTEREQFYQRLQKQVASKQFSSSFLRSKVLPKLTANVEFNKDVHAIPVVGAIAESCLSSALPIEKAAVQSMFVKSITCGDRSLRVALFSLAPSQLQPLVDCIEPAVLSKEIWPSFSGGFIDTTVQVRELSVRALVCFANKLSQDILNGDMLKFLARLQVDEQPTIRTNTTIALGKLSVFLNDGTKAKVLLPAFTRALRDPFPPARRAALSALAATHTFYSAQECAVRIIPAASTCLLELDPSIREIALDVVRSCIKTLEAFQPTLDKQWQVQLQQQQQQQPTVAATDSSVLNWASKWLASPESDKKASSTAIDQTNSLAVPTDVGKLTQSPPPPHVSKPAPTTLAVTKIESNDFSSGWDDVEEEEDGWRSDFKPINASSKQPSSQNGW